MNKRIADIGLHVLGWIVMISFSYFTTVKMLVLGVDPSRDRFFLIPFVISNSLMIGIFYLNYYLIIPKILFRGKYWLYGIICISLFVFILKLPDILHPSKIDFHKKPPRFENRKPPCTDCIAFSLSILERKSHSKPFLPSPNPKFDRNKGMIFPMLFSNMLLMYIISFVASITIRVSNRLREIEKDRAEAQLNYLKSQVNPHFLYNTLNGIYALTLIKSDAAPKMVERLSKIMRYSLREAQQKKVLLNDELQYIMDYIELQRSRLTVKTKLIVINSIPETNLEIAPLLFIPFIENAFKYGVSTEEESEIQVHFELDGDVIQMMVKNQKVNLQTEFIEKSGMGIENTKARLNLTYLGNHELFIAERENDFLVLLRIKLNPLT